MVSPVKVDANRRAQRDDEPSQVEIDAFFDDGALPPLPPTSPSLNDSGNVSEATPRPPEAEVDAVATNNPGMAGEKYIEHFIITSWK